jgi:hypothetical protein
VCVCVCVCVCVKKERKIQPGRLFFFLVGVRCLWYLQIFADFSRKVGVKHVQEYESQRMVGIQRRMDQKVEMADQKSKLEYARLLSCRPPCLIEMRVLSHRSMPTSVSCFFVDCAETNFNMSSLAMWVLSARH